MQLAGRILLVAVLSVAGPILAAEQQPPAKPALARTENSLSWNDLSAAQKTALQPLAPVWNDISANRKRKWIALSASFGKLTAADQATLHGRMQDWASLSPAERNRARLNFAQSRKLTAADKKAQWDAYQALSPEEKRKLAEQATKPAGAALAVTQMQSGKLAAVPTTRSDGRLAKSRPVKAASPAASAAASSP